MDEIKVSIIIPVYNSEKYLGKCLDSIIAQTYKNFEIIVVDDGSKDSSAKICDDYALSDSRVKVIHQKNGGTSKARNAGLKAAAGDYITFMDNDDYWKSDDCLEKVINRLKESRADVMIHTPYVYWQDTKELVSPKNTIKREQIYGKPSYDVINTIIKNGLMDRCVWSKLFKREIIEKNSLKFPENCRNEDTYFIGEIFMYAESYDWMEESFYIYRKGHEESQTSKRLSYQSLNDLQRIVCKYIDMLNKAEIEELKKEALYNYIAYLYSVWMGQSYLIDRKSYKKEIRLDTVKMKKYDYILKYDADPSVALIRKVKKILGFTITSRLLAMYIKRNNHQ